MTIETFSGGDLPPRVYCRSGKPVLLDSEDRARKFRMLLVVTDTKPLRWKIGRNENGWWFCYRS